MPVFMQTMITEVIFLPEKSLSSSEQLKTFGFLHLQLTVLLQELTVYSTMALFCLITTFTHQTDRNAQFLVSQTPPDWWYNQLCTVKENNYCFFLIFRITVSKAALSHVGKCTSTFQLMIWRSPLTNEQERWYLNTLPSSNSPPFPIPTKIYVLSLGLPAVPVVHMEDQENLELPPKNQTENWTCLFIGRAVRKAGSLPRAAE